MAAKKKTSDTNESAATGSEDAAQEMVRIRITKFGDGKISTGIHRAGFGDVMAGRGHEIEVDLATAKAHEAQGLAEIVEGQG